MIVYAKFFSIEITTILHENQLPSLHMRIIEWTGWNAGSHLMSLIQLKFE